MNPDEPISTLQQQILQKTTVARIHNALDSYEQQRIRDNQYDMVQYLKSSINSNCIILYSYALKFILNNSLLGSDDMCLIYNGKVLCPYNALVDYCNPKSSCRNSINNANENIGFCRNTPITIHASYPIKGGCFIISFSILMTMLIAMSMSLCTCGLSLFVIPILAPFLFILPLFCL